MPVSPNTDDPDLNLECMLERYLKRSEVELVISLLPAIETDIQRDAFQTLVKMGFGGGVAVIAQKIGEILVGQSRSPEEEHRR